MTSKVIIEACCADNKEVLVTINDTDTTECVEQFRLNYGEKAERFVYDARQIVVIEVLKEPASA